MTVFEDSSRGIRIAQGRPDWIFPPRQIGLPWRGNASVWLHEYNSATWLNYTLGKQLLERHYPADMVYVAERFPPLQGGMTGLPRAQFLGRMLEREQRPWWDRSAAIWLAEALHRDLSASEYVALFGTYGEALIKATIDFGDGAGISTGPR